MITKQVIALLIVICQLIVVDAHAQTFSPKANPTTGAYNQASGMSFSWTMGETFNATLSGGSIVFTQGEQQPYPPHNPTLTLTPDHMVSCYGMSNGHVLVNVNSGSGNFTYNINGGTWLSLPIYPETQVNFSNLAAGTYTICALESSTNTTVCGTVTITSPASALSISSVTESSMISCIGYDGAFSITTSGGTPFDGAGNPDYYQYAWQWNNGLNSNASNGGSLFTTNSLTTPDTYTITAVDANGCSASSTVDIHNVTIPAFDVNGGPITVACGGASTHVLHYTNGLSGAQQISGSVTSTLSAIPNACGGPVTETWTYTDCFSRTINSSRIITVLPSVLPTIIAPPNISVSCGNLPSPTTLTFTNGENGNCTISGTSNLSTFSAAVGTCGTITETWTATDMCGRALAPITRNITLLPGVSLHAKAMLAGPYIGPWMHDSLRVKNQIPFTEPYTLPPYNKAVIGGPSGESITSSILEVSGQNAMVDWVYLELRDAANPSNVIASKRALIQRDGDIVSNDDGASAVIFPTVCAGNYFISIKHRNHLGAMTAAAINFSGCVATNYDFTLSPVYSNPAIPTNTPLKNINGVNALWPADANNNKNAKYNGTGNDKDIVLSVVGSGTPNNSLEDCYRREDVNMDGKVRYNNTDNDRAVIINTVGTSTPNAIKYQHTPN